MSRSFGDKVAAQVGIIAEPELQHFERTPDLSFMLIASDGVWEFMDDQECVEFIDTEMTTGKRSFYEAVDALVIECARARVPRGGPHGRPLISAPTTGPGVARARRQRTVAAE